MKLEDQVCSLELAKRLKELGVNQESVFYWTCKVDGWPLTCPIFHIGFSPRTPEWISAFTVAEMGEMITDALPATFIRTEFYRRMVIVECLLPSGEWHKIGDRKATEGQTEADARAKMLIYLIEQRLVKP